MIQKTFNIELTLDVDDSYEYVDMKMNTYYEVYKFACNLEEKARKKEKKLSNYSDLAGTDSYKEARDAWEKAYKDWQVKAEIRHFSWQVYYQSTKQLRESDIQLNILTAGRRQSTTRIIRSPQELSYRHSGHQP